MLERRRPLKGGGCVFLTAKSLEIEPLAILYKTMLTIPFPFHRNTLHSPNKVSHYKTLSFSNHPLYNARNITKFDEF